jgi:hypothetical protein
MKSSWHFASEYRFCFCERTRLAGRKDRPRRRCGVRRPRIVSVVEQQMSARLWDLSDDSRQELESVDFFEAREKLPRLVMRGLGSVEHMSRAWAPLQSG